MPLPVNGRPLKALNQWYNQQRAHYQSLLTEGQHTSHRLDLLTDKRQRQVESYLQVASRRIIDQLVAHRIGILVIGRNQGWKQRVNLGARTNQSFVFLPHARFIQMLTYKAALVGIQVIVTEESYTSKASFLDADPLPVYDPTQPALGFSGKRVKRGLYRASDGRQLNADVNGSYNVMRKVVPNAFGKGRVGVVVHPVRLCLANRRLAS